MLRTKEAALVSSPYRNTPGFFLIGIHMHMYIIWYCEMKLEEEDKDDNKNNNNKRETRDISIEHLYKMFVMHAQVDSYVLRPAAPSPSAAGQLVSHLRTGHWLNPLLQEACSNEHTRYTVESIEIYSAFWGTDGEQDTIRHKWRRRSQWSQEDKQETWGSSTASPGWWWWWPHLDCGPYNNNNTNNNNNVAEKWSCPPTATITTAKWIVGPRKRAVGAVNLMGCVEIIWDLTTDSRGGQSSARNQ